MPLDIVRKYRTIYRNYYMVPTLQNFGQQLELQAFDDEGRGFKEKYIVVNFSGTFDSSILAATVISGDKKRHREVYVDINPEVGRLPKAKQKVVLALEWLHAMLGFRDGGFDESKRISDKIEFAILFNNLKRRSFWQEPEETKIQFHNALRHLLVSTDSMTEELAETFDLSMEDVRNKIKKNPNEAYVIINQFVQSFSGKWDIEPELVYDRFHESIFQLV